MTIMKKIIPAISIALTTTLANATLGPIPIYLNTEYRTETPVIESIASTLSFNADDIAATGANTFLDFLATVPSVGLVDAQGNVPAVFIRGGNSDHTLFLVDGVSVNDIGSVNGAIEYGLVNIALNDIEKIGIVKSSGSVLYGSSAIAGIIAITTKKGADREQATVSTKFGTHNSKTYALSASSGSKDGYIRFTHNKYTTDGINALIKDTTGEKDGISNRSTQIKFGNKVFDIGYLISNNKTNYDNNFGVTPSTINDGFFERDLSKITINVNKKISTIWKTKLSLNQTKYNRKFEFGNDKLNSTNITILNDIKINDALLNVGLSQVNDENITKKNKLSSKDLFVNWQKNIDSIDVNIGSRYIKHDNFDHHTLYDVGVGKYLDNGIKLTANYNTAFQAPSLFQISPNATTNNILKPETSNNINLSIGKQHAWGEIGLALYKNKVKNVINGNNYPVYTNKDKLTTKGAELFINANFSDYNINFSHDYNKSMTNNETTQSIRRAKNTSNLTVRKQYGKFNSRVQIIKKSSSLDRGNVEIKGYTLLNLSTNYVINDNANVSLNIKNAADKDYTVANGYNQLGRTVEIGLNYQF